MNKIRSVRIRLSLLALALCLAFGLLPAQAMAATALDAWEQAPLYGGYIRALAGDGTKLYAGTDSGEVYRSADGGAHWASASSGLPSGAQIYALLCDGNAIYAGGNADAKLYKSVDGGQTWQVAGAGLPDGNIHALCRFKDALYASVWSGGVYTSTDGGASWGRVFSADDPTALYTYGTTLYAGTQSNGVYMSTDGSSWSQVGSTNPSGSLKSLCSDGETLYAGTYQNGLYAYPLSGDSWTQVSDGPPTTAYVRALYLDDTTLYAGTVSNGVWKMESSDWEPASADLPRGNSTGVNAFYKQVGTLYAGTGGFGVHKMAEGEAAWSQASVDIPSLESALTLYDNGAELYCGTGLGLRRRADGGASWPLAAPLRGWVSALCEAGDALFAGGNGGVYKRTDDGAAWNPAGTGIPAEQRIHSMCADSSGVLYAGTFYRDIYTSVNSGASWTPLTFPTGGDNVGNLYALLARGTDLYAAVAHSIYKSTDGEGTWNQIDPASSGLPSGYFVARTLLSTGPALYVGGNQGIYKSMDDGASWGPASSGLPAGSSVLALTAYGGNLYAGIYAAGQYRVYASENGGASWHPVGGDLPDSINALRVFGGKLYAATDVGLFEARITTIDSGGESDTTPPVITSVTATPYGPNGAILEVSATDVSLPLSYQWQVQGSWLDIPGATSARFDYAGLETGKSYTVRVKVWDADGNQTISAPITFKAGAVGLTVPKTGDASGALPYALLALAALCGAEAVAYRRKRT